MSWSHCYKKDGCISIQKTLFHQTLTDAHRAKLLKKDFQNNASIAKAVFHKQLYFLSLLSFLSCYISSDFLVMFPHFPPFSLDFDISTKNHCWSHLNISKRSVGPCVGNAFWLKGGQLGHWSCFLDLALVTLFGPEGVSWGHMLVMFFNQNLSWSPLAQSETLKTPQKDTVWLLSCPTILLGVVARKAALA